METYKNTEKQTDKQNIQGTAPQTSCGNNCDRTPGCQIIISYCSHENKIMLLMIKPQYITCSGDNALNILIYNKATN